jgi:hypothetical protein
VTTANMPGCDSTFAVTATMPVLGFHKWFVRLAFMEIRIDHLDDKSSAW